MVTKKAGRARAVPWPERLKVWVGHGGRCAFCNAYMLESELTLRPVSLGELAHNIASSDDGPRADPSLSEAERNAADNLLLLCGQHHPDVDKASQLDVLTVEQLTAFKQAHEAKIRLATERVGSPATAVLRLQGNVKTAAVDLSARAAADAVIRSAARFPYLPFSHDRQGVEIDLRQLPGEHEGAAAYYEAAMARIDEMINMRFKPAVESGGIDHVSVLAFARLPVLVYLGSRLDDTIATDIYQRYRAGETWVWGEDLSADPRFRFRRDGDVPSVSTEGVLIVNASGTIHPQELPAAVAALPCYVIELEHGTPHADTVRSRAIRDSFERALRELLGEIEWRHKTVKRLHVFAAAPVSIAVILGRCIGWGIHPNLVVYDRAADGSYHPAMEVSAP